MGNWITWQRQCGNGLESPRCNDGNQMPSQSTSLSSTWSTGTGKMTASEPRVTQEIFEVNYPK